MKDMTLAIKRSTSCLFLFRSLQPSVKFLGGNNIPVAVLFLFSCSLAPVIKLLVRDAPGLDPSEAPLVFLAVGLEYRILRLAYRPLLQCADLTAASLPGRNRALAVLRAHAACLREIASAVLAAADGNAALDAAPQ